MSGSCCCCFGPQGPQGVPGLQGPQGLQGVPGRDCDCQGSGRSGDSGCCCERYFNVFSLTAQVVGPYLSPTDTVLFDQQNVVSSQSNVSAIMSVAQAASAGANAAAAVLAAGGSVAQAAAAQGAVVAGLSYEQGGLAAQAAALLAGATPAQANAALAAVQISAGNPLTILTVAAALAAGLAAQSAALLPAGATAAQGLAAKTAVIAGQSYTTAALASGAAVIAAGGTAVQANAASQAILLLSTVTSLDFDLSLMPSTGEIKFLKHGIYHLAWQLQARITPPVPNPVPSWSFGFWLNGILVPGSIYSGFTQAPGDDACHSTGDIIIEIRAGDVLKLRNTSVSSVNLNPNVTGSVFPITIATVVAECLRDLP